MSSMGELTFFLGFQVQQKEDGIFISQDKYVAEILKKFDFATAKTANTLIETNKALVKDEEAKAVDVHLYRSMIGSLMYLPASRPYIIFYVCACARFQVTPKTSHIHAVKRVFIYFKGQPKLGLWYPRDSPFDLEAFSNSDYARASLDRKSTIGGCQFLRRRLISWQCKKQTIVANSTTKAEYIVAANCCSQVLWIQNQMLDYGLKFMNTKIYIDNESTICIVKNPVFHSKTKHIEIRHHFIRDSYEKKLIQMIKIHTDDNVADLLTKAFDMRLSIRSRKTEWKGLPLVPRYHIRGVEAQTRFEAASKKSNDPPISRVNTLGSGTGSGEDNMKLNELMELYIKLSDVFADTHNLVAFLEKPEESNRFEEIIDFLNASSVQYALTVSPIIYTSCIEQFWATAKLQALVDKKKVIIIETSIRSDLNLEDAGGTDCLPTATIFEELARIGAKTTAWNEFGSTMASAIICLATNQKFNLCKYIFDTMLGDMSHYNKTYVNPSHTKKIFTNMKREGKDFFRRVTPLFATMMVQSNQDIGEDLAAPSDSHSIPIISQPSSSKPQKKKSRRKHRKDSAPTEPTTEETPDEAHVSIPSCDPPQSELKEKSKEFGKEKEVKNIRVQEIKEEVTLVDETQEMNDDNLMFDTGVLEEQEKDVAEKEVSAAEIKAAKPKAVTSAATTTTTTTTRPKARRVEVQESSEFKTTSSSLQASQLPQAKDKGKKEW
ncbi:hypothetical protein Tco_1336792 [Tanacetum coccineum]